MSFVTSLSEVLYYVAYGKLSLLEGVYVMSLNTAFYACIAIAIEGCNVYSSLAVMI